MLPRRRAVMVMWVGFVYRTKYYFVWALAESGLILSGLCFNGRGEDGAVRWDKFINARIRYVLVVMGIYLSTLLNVVLFSNVETCTSAALLATNWNIATGLWLRHCAWVLWC